MEEGKALLAKLPKKVKVGGYNFAIMLVEPKFGDLDDDDGMTMYDKCWLLLNEERDFQSVVNTLFHELQHIIDYVYGIVDGAEEELVANQSGNGWHALWHDNPGLLRWVSRAFVLQRGNGKSNNKKKGAV